eukprot:6179113-Pleurochrysis_carterae.AAC.5
MRAHCTAPPVAVASLAWQGTARTRRCTRCVRLRIARFVKPRAKFPQLHRLRILLTEFDVPNSMSAISVTASALI